MDLLIKKKQPSILRLHKEQYHFLSLLLKQGYSLLECLKILQIDITLMQCAIEEGKTIHEIFIQGNKGKFYEHLKFFLTVQDVGSAIEASLRMDDFEKGVIQKLVKSLIYPIFILLFSYVLLCFFTQFIIPQMLVSFSNDSSLFLIKIIHSVQQILTYLMLGSGVGSIVFLCVQYKSTWKITLYKTFGTYMFLHKDHTSFLFAGYLIELQKQGISTKDSIHYLQAIKKVSFFYIMINDMLEKLEEGNDFIEVIQNSLYLNHRFKVMIPLGILGSHTMTTLSLFIEQQQYCWERLRKKVTLSIQLLAYMFVALLVVIVYQMMLIPLSMLEQFS